MDLQVYEYRIDVENRYDQKNVSVDRLLLILKKLVLF